ncbi:MAG: PCRF domain-containing protein, partial [Bacteroidota bacterium]
MIDKLEAIKTRLQEVSTLLTQPEVLADRTQYKDLSKEYKDLAKVTAVYDRYRKVLADIQSAQVVLNTEKDPDFKAMAKEELEALGQRQRALEEELKTLLIPKDPNDSKNIILEIRAGTGGDEAA